MRPTNQASCREKSAFGPPQVIRSDGVALVDQSDRSVSGETSSSGDAAGELRLKSALDTSGLHMKNLFGMSENGRQVQTQDRIAIATFFFA